MRLVRSIVLVCGITCLAVPQFASAATLSTDATRTFISYTAAAGEANNLTVTHTASGFVFSDSVAVTPAAPCFALSATSAACPDAPSEGQIAVALNDQADSATVDASISGLSIVSVQGNLGADTITGGPNVTNNLSGNDGGDALTGGGLQDSLDGGPDNDTITGGGGNDGVNGGLGTDSLAGETGNDTYSSSGVDGADAFSGGSGTDSVSYSSRGTAVAISLDGEANDGDQCPGASCEGDNIGTDVEGVSSGTGNDVLTGSGLANNLSSGGGNDVVDGGDGGDSIFTSAGDDAAFGGAGSDSINLGVGADTTDAGPGDDSIGANPEDEADTYSGGEGYDNLFDGPGTPLALKITLDGAPDDGLVTPPFPVGLDNAMPDIEGVSGGPGDDMLVGNAADNELVGGDGNDTLIAGEGADSVFGGDGNDSLDGGNASDSLEGEAGADSIRSRDNAADQIDCGSAVDLVLADSHDAPEASCEQASTGLAIGDAKRAGKVVELEVSCPVAEAITCKVKATLRLGGKTIASGKDKVKSGKTEAIALELTADGADALSRPGTQHADAAASFTDASGQKLTTKRKVAVG